MVLPPSPAGRGGCFERVDPVGGRPSGNRGCVVKGSHYLGLLEVLCMKMRRARLRSGLPGLFPGRHALIWLGLIVGCAGSSLSLPGASYIVWGVGSENAPGWPAGWPGVVLVHPVFSVACGGW